MKKCKPGPCAFCRREGLEILSDADYATGSYRRQNDEPEARPLPFRGNVCDFHRDNENWVTFRWAPK